jgi:membrane protein YdbS with pleckstrin-like domain
VVVAPVAAPAPSVAPPPWQGERYEAAAAKPSKASTSPDGEIVYTASPSMFRNEPIQFVLGVALCFLVIGIPFMLRWWLNCKVTTLTITDRKTILRRGILSKSVSEVWHRDVRNVQIDQSFFQRLLGVGTLKVSSAGQSGFEIDVSGLPHPSRAKNAIDAGRATR